MVDVQMRNEKINIALQQLNVIKYMISDSNITLDNR